MNPGKNKYDVRGDRLLNADGIRGIACLIVLTVHSTSFFHPALAVPLQGAGKIGVWLFFVLSSFLLTRHLMSTGINRDVLLDYSVGRFLRVIPLFVLAVVIYKAFGTAGIDSWSDVMQAISLRKGYGHLWTIPAEFKFYVLLPIVLAAALLAWQRHGKTSAILLVVATAIAFALVFPYTEAPENSTQVGWYAPCFLFGVIAAMAMDGKAAQFSSRTRWTYNIAMAVTLVLMTNPFRQTLFPWTPNDWLMNKFILLGAMFSFFLVLNINSQGLSSLLLGNKCFSAIGTWSYSIYLFHWLIIVLLSQHYLHSVAMQMAAIFTSIMLGAFLHFSVERPLMRGRRAVFRMIGFKPNLAT
jgi:peptidoglycan/LPS O-acetylase OafA/YrhL